MHIWYRFNHFPNYRQRIQLHSNLVLLLACPNDNLIHQQVDHFPRATAAYQAFMERVRERAELAYSIQGHAQGRFGPDIEIYRFKS